MKDTKIDDLFREVIGLLEKQIEIVKHQQNQDGAFLPDLETAISGLWMLMESAAMFTGGESNNEDS